VQELADVLRTAAGDRDLCGPLQGRLPGGHVDDEYAADEFLLSGYGPSVTIPSVATTAGSTS
jgi:hypothetical protein